MVTTRPLRQPFDRHPLARESMVAIALLGAFALWVQVATRIAWGILDLLGWQLLGAGSLVSFAAYAGVTGGLTALGMLGFAGAYVVLRDIELRVGGLDRSVLAYSVGGVAAAVMLVGLVKLVATATGTTMGTMVGTSVAADAPFAPVVLITFAGLVIGLPAYLLGTHVLVQRTIDRVATDRVVVGVTTLAVWLVEPTGVVDASLLRVFAGTAMIVLAIALPVVAASTYDRRWLTAVAAVPLTVLIVGVSVDRVVDFQGVADGLFALGQLAVVAVGVAAYQRTDSMLPSALAYATFVVAADLVVIALEAGVGV